MIFQRFYDENLAQASYLIGCEKSRTAIVIDPTTQTDRYTSYADSRKLGITHVTETHVHADFVSGCADLAATTGARMLLSAEGTSEWGYDFSRIPKARKLRNGDQVTVGSVALRVLHTPGHTPEHLTFLVADSTRGESPVGALTGDFIFVGEVGRPDLLERAAGALGTTRDAAVALFKSVQAFRVYPDHLQIWPGHGAGSACGKALGSMPFSTLGYEKLFNWAFHEDSGQKFVAEVLKDQPIPPRYFVLMKRMNRLAQRSPRAKPLSRLSANAFSAALDGNAIVVDTRPAAAFAAGHIPGTINIPFNKSFLNWMGALVDYDRDLVLILDEAGASDAPREIQRQLQKIGLLRIAGWAGSDTLAAWQAGNGNLQLVPQLAVNDLHARSESGPVRILDVRSPHEWAEGHLPGAIHIPLALLADHAAELAAGAGPIAIHCGGGGRSAIGASLLQSHGAGQVMNVAGGYDGWVAAGYSVERDSSEG